MLGRPRADRGNADAASVCTTVGRPLPAVHVIKSLPEGVSPPDAPGMLRYSSTKWTQRPASPQSDRKERIRLSMPDAHGVALTPHCHRFHMRSVKTRLLTERVIHRNTSRGARSTPKRR